MGAPWWGEPHEMFEIWRPLRRHFSLSRAQASPGHLRHPVV